MIDGDFLSAPQLVHDADYSKNCNLKNIEHQRFINYQLVLNLPLKIFNGNPPNDEKVATAKTIGLCA